MTEINNENKDKIAKIIQKYLENNPVIVLGSGASIPYGLPSMSELSKLLKEKITPIDDKSGTKFLSDLEKTNDLEKSLQNIELSQDLLVVVVREIWNFMNEKDFELYNKFLNDYSSFSLQKMFAKLLQSSSKHVKVVTTNYDRIAEYAGDLCGANVYTGFSGRYILNFGQRYFSNALNQERVDVWKVHGSLDWFKNGDKVFSSPISKEIPENSIPLMVTPGIAKYQQTHSDPYRTIISNADDALVNASCFLCIGYGFNDEHIQPKLIQQIKQKDIPIVVVVKELSSAGKELLLKKKTRSVVLEENGLVKTKISFFEENDLCSIDLDGSYWQVEHFLNLWF